MKVNAELNVSTSNLHVAEYDWGEIPAGVPVTEAEVVLAADCVYFEVCPQVLVRTPSTDESVARVPITGQDVM